LPETTLAALLCCLGWKKRRPLQMLLLLMAGVVGLSLLNGCGSTTQPTTSTVTVTAISGTIEQTTTITLTVN